MRFSIIIPAYNEEQRIAPTLRSIGPVLHRYGEDFEILVADDGSTDRTAAVVEALRGEVPNLSCLSGGQNRGKGHAVRTGMLAARGRVRLMCDADGSIPASQLPKLLEPVLSGQVDVAIGSRRVAGASARNEPPRWRNLWSRLSNRFVRATLLPGVRDTQCGFKAFSAAAAEAVFSRARIDGWAFDLEVLCLVRRLGFSLREIGIHWSDDRRSRVDPVHDFLRVVRDWAAIYGSLRGGGSLAGDGLLASGQGKSKS